MARFILDVANCTDEQTQNIMNLVCSMLSSKVTTITLVDKTNEGQFYEDESKNILTEEQINNFNLKK